MENTELHQQVLEEQRQSLELAERLGIAPQDATLTAQASVSPERDAIPTTLVRNTTPPSVAEEELDFSKEPVFEDSTDFETIPIPGIPGAYISVKKSVTYAVSSGRSNFASQEQSLVTGPNGKKRPSDKMKVNYDVFGLFVYKCVNCLADWCIIDMKTGKKEKFTGSDAQARRVFANIKSEKLCQWISDQIDRVVGWSEEDDELEEQFPSKTS